MEKGALVPSTGHLGLTRFKTHVGRGAMTFGDCAMYFVFLEFHVPMCHLLSPRGRGTWAIYFEIGVPEHLGIPLIAPNISPIRIPTAKTTPTNVGWSHIHIIYTSQNMPPPPKSWQHDYWFHQHQWQWLVLQAHLQFLYSEYPRVIQQFTSWNERKILKVEFTTIIVCEFRCCCSLARYVICS